MGNAQVPRVDEPRLLLTEFSDLAFQDVLGSYKLFKVMRCVHAREGLVLVKLFIHREGAPNLHEVKQKVLQMKSAFRSHWLYPNVVPYQSMEIAGQSSILLRQHFARNLYDRIHTRPFLSDAAKGWIAFQVLCSVCQAHATGIAHGDLKTENIFVSSSGHAVLSDFALFKPLLLPENDPSEFSFFFESNLNRRRCYLAPERFDAPAGRTSSGSHDRFSWDLAAMDVFSLGCVLAELFLDGQTLMDLPELLLYRAGQLDLRGKIAAIKSPAIQELIGSMLHRDPSQRRSAMEYLREWCERVASRPLINCIFPLSLLLQHPIYQQPEMRITLLRHNFARLLWCSVGHAAIAHALGLPAAGGGDQPSPALVWEMWLRHVGRNVRSPDGATMHIMVHTAMQAASQWMPEMSAGMTPGAIGEAGLGTASGEASAAEQGDHTRPEPHGHEGTPIAPSIFHPELKESSCERFVLALFGLWEEGYTRCAASGISDPAEPLAQGVYESFLTDLCTGHAAEVQDAAPSSGVAAVEPGAEGPPERDDLLSIVCEIICSALQHLSNPRMKLVCLDMFEALAPFTSQATVLEQIVPYCHVLMSDPVAKVRGKAIDVLTHALDRVEELPPSDTPIFMEYLFPQLMSSISGMSGEPVVLLAVARNIGALVRHAVRFAELSVAAAQRSGGCEQAAAAERDAGLGQSSEVVHSTDAAVEIEAFDVQWKHLIEEAKQIIQALLECLRAAGEGTPLSSPAGHEDALLNFSIGREVRIAILRNMCTLADSFGRDDTHNFLLKYLITFMNDPAWEVRAAFCEEAALLPRRVGQVSTEGIIWPCYEQALLDQEERVLAAALRGLAVLVSQQVLRRQSLVTVASKVAPLLVHPSASARQSAVEVLQALGKQLSAVDQYVFIMPEVWPFLRMRATDLRSTSGALARSALCRRLFKRALLRRDEELHEALVKQKPLPAAVAEQDGDGQDSISSSDWEALELLRPFLLPFLRGRPQVAANAAPSGREENGKVEVPTTAVQSVQYATVNPHRLPSRPLQTLAESERECCHVASLGRVGLLQHPLSLLSPENFILQALCLPPPRRALGWLTYLDGTPYSIYAASAPRTDGPEGGLELRQSARLDDSMLTRRESVPITQPQRSSSATSEAQAPQDPWESSDAVATEAAAAAAVAASSVGGERRWPWPAEEGGTSPLGAIDTEVEGGRMSAHNAGWRPRGVLLATLYEYAHQSGVPVVKVDSTDDSRILVTGGKDGTVKIWNCARLERDVAVSSSHTFTVPGHPTPRPQKLRGLRTVRDAKAVVVGTELGEALLYKMEPSRGGTTATQVCRFDGSCKHGACAVMCLEQFDSELESLVVFAQEHGHVQGWDIRSRGCSWSVKGAPPWLGVPSCLALGSDGHAIVLGTLGGGLLVYDLRFLAPWKQWRVSSGAAVLCLRSANNFGPSPGAFVALGGDSNEVALFDVVRGSCLTLFLTEPGSAAAAAAGAEQRQQPAAVTVPSLVPVAAPDRAPGATPATSGITPEQLSGCLPAPGAKRAAGCVRSLWLPQRGAQTFLLAGGTDRKVRCWSLDPEYYAAEAYVVTPPDPHSTGERARERTTYSSSHLGDVFVVQEQQAPRGSLGGVAQAAHLEDARPRGTNPNHRDAILDMCTISLQQDILVTAGRDGLVKLWK